jgi:purine-binding chemotaxis protein CheW
VPADKTEEERKKATQDLVELVAEINRETETAADEEPGQEGLQKDPGDVRARQYIQFNLGTTLLGIPLLSGLEIGHLPDITSLPNLPDWVLGISNIRGEIVSIVDLKGFFGWPTRGPERGSRFIVMHNEDTKVGMVVDGIRGILSLDRIDADIQGSPFSRGEISSYVSGFVVSDEQPLYILDADKLLSSPRMTSFMSES